MVTKNLRQYEFKLGKLGLVLFIIGLSVLVFVGFLLGVQVGRNIDTYPDMIARGIPGKILGSVGLTSSDAKPEIPAVTSGAAPVEAPAPAADRKADKAPEGENAAAIIMAPQASKEAVAGPKEPAPTAAPEAKPAPATPAEAPVPKAAPTPQRAPSAAAVPVAEKPSPAKTDAVASDKNGKYTVQVVSFREKEKAEGLSRKIKELGYGPKVTMTDVPGKGQWYRVTINNFATKPAAEKAADDLTKKIKGVTCVIKTN